MDRSNNTLPLPPQLQWPGRSNVAIFIKTLHLLDLDLLPDWPSISQSTFHTGSKSLANQNLQHRVKAVEWALYRLFSIYSPEETRSKLSPFFPSATPIQSLNLRAALYKCLTELKKNGVLPRDMVLRKTMLDECKGEKVEELLAGFALVVLRRHMDDEERKTGKPGHGKRNGKDRDTGLDMKTHQYQDSATLVPLILAHRSSIQQSLQKRQELRQKAKAKSEQLAHLQNEIAEDLELISQADAVEALPAEEYEALRDQVQRAFVSDRRWADYLFDGNPSSIPQSTLESLKWPFDESSQPENHPRETEDPAEEKANEPMRELQSVLSQRRERVQKLARLRESLLSAKELEKEDQPADPDMPISTEATSADQSAKAHADVDAKAPPRRFNRHQELTLNNLTLIFPRAVSTSTPQRMDPRNPR